MNFRTHVYNIRHQYKAYRQCIDGLTGTEVALHIDFSENYALSSNQNHGPSAIWAHLRPILSEVKNKHPVVTTVHFFSDGSATQYKEKINFYLMANRFFENYEFRKISWNFFESGHGKGAADGVGGTLKRQADAIVARGADIADAYEFFSTLQDVSKIKLFMVTDEDIENVAKTIPSKIIPLKGTMQKFYRNSWNIKL
ncbi:unnamed protein product [Parnassius apollo]|uniref:(apollo) hypothetical protein n=1 Tax=Parnassius apollo TaxID=110799 RepID=A0A8S3VYU5_PARAO|nr:unnamed protein product [Parnassius apollo]